MKLIRNIIFIFVILLVLAKIGWLKPEIASKVEDVGNRIYEKASTVEYKGKQVSDMTVSELAANVKTDVSNITDDVEIDGTKISVKNDRLQLLVNPESETVVYARFSSNDEESADTVSNILKGFTNLDYELIALSMGKEYVEVELKKNPDGTYDTVIK